MGAHLEAIRRNGLRVLMHDGTERHAKGIPATDSYAEAGKQDLVILALKAHVIEHVAKDMRALYGPDTIVLPLQNGLPWWYFQRHGGEFEGRRIELLDPHGTIAAHVEPERILGCVVYPASEVTAPGVIRHVEGNRFPVGELDGQETERARAVAEVIDNIRAEIWLKLWGNLSFNPISALTHATLMDICQYPLTRDLAAKLMTEAQTIANKLGITFRVSLEKRIEGAEKVGKHKTSTLQDVEVGRPLELDALMGAVIELGRMTGIPTPHIDAVHACVKLLNEVMVSERVGVKAYALG
jgi:2-dehydropantoate 2-reductase